MTNSIGQKLKTLRKLRKLTQEQAAEQLGITRATVSNYEVGRRSPHISELKRIGEFYGVGLDYFGLAPTDEVFDLISRAREVFESDAVPREKRQEIFDELMKLYIRIK